MKDIIINKKYLFGLICILIANNSIAKKYDPIDAVIDGKDPKSVSTSAGDDPHGNMPAAQAPQFKHFKKKIKIDKKKDGRYHVAWKIFTDYDSQKREPGQTLKQIINKDVTVKGFMIPLDFTAKKIKEFLLVPFIPSCAHVPAPPENMIISVKVKKKGGIKPSYFPIYASGKLKYTKGQKTQDPYLPISSFTMELDEFKVKRR